MKHYNIVKLTGILIVTILTWLQLTGQTIVFAQTPIITTIGNQSRPAMACSDETTTCLLVYTDAGTTIKGQLLNSSSGSLIGSAFQISTSTGQEYPAVTYNPHDDEFLVVWHDNRTNFWDVYGQRVSVNGTLSGGEITIYTGTDHQYYPDVAYNVPQQKYLVVWGSPTGTYGQFIARNGSLSGGSFAISTTGNETVPAIACRGNECLVVWTYAPASNGEEIYGRRVYIPDGTLLGSEFMINVGNTGEAQFSPDIEYNRIQDEYLVAWYDGSSPTGYYIQGRRVSSTDTLLGTLIPISLADNAGYPVSIAYSTNSLEYLVTYGQAGGVYGRKVFYDGSMPSSEFNIASSTFTQWYEPTSPVAYNRISHNWLVVWDDYRNTPTDYDIYGKMYNSLASDNVGFSKFSYLYGYFGVSTNSTYNRRSIS